MSAIAGDRVGPAVRRAAAVLEAGFRLGATARRGKPIHPRGVVLDATVTRFGSRRGWGVPWLDQPGADAGVVRLSRSLGLPRPLPDVLGLALRFEDGEGRHELLLATAGLGRLTRFVLVPHRDPAASAYTSVLPYRSPRGPVLLAVAPHPPREPGSPTRLRSRLLAASPAGAWEEFGMLELVGRLDGPDAPITFDPVLHPLPGLWMSPALATLRERSYAGARRGSGRDR